MFLKSLLISSKAHIFTILLAVILTYSNIFANDFVWDDYAFVTDWSVIRDVGAGWSRLWAGEVPPGHEGVYRPVRSVLYGISYSFFGNNPLGYHLLSVAIHIGASVLVYLIVLELMSEKVAAFVSGLWFGVLPIHVEAITWIAASMDSFGVMLMLFAVWSYLKSKQRIKNAKKWYWVAVCSATFVYFSYELTLVLPVILLAIDWTTSKSKMGGQTIMFKKFIPFVGANIAYWIVRLDFLTIPGGQPRVFDGFVENIFLSALMLVRYLWLMLVPKLSVNHAIRDGVSGFYYHDFNFEKLPANIGLFDLDVLLSLFVLVFMVWIVIKKTKDLPMVSLSIIWFLVALLPIMIVPSFGIIFAERYAYMASVGMAILVGWAFLMLMSKKTIPRSLIPGSRLLVAITLLAYSLVSWQRNGVWKDSVTLWSEALRQRPDSAIIHTNLGFSYQRIGETKKAIELFEKAVSINPNNIVNQESLATAYEISDQVDKARTPLLYLTKLDGGNYSYYVRLGDAEYQLKNYQEAAKYYNYALKIDPAQSYVNGQLMKLAEQKK